MALTSCRQHVTVDASLAMHHRRLARHDGASKQARRGEASQSGKLAESSAVLIDVDMFKAIRIVMSVYIAHV